MKRPARLETSQVLRLAYLSPSPPVLTRTRVHKSARVANRDLDLGAASASKRLASAHGWKFPPPATILLLINSQEVGIYRNVFQMECVAARHIVAARILEREAFRIGIQDKRLEPAANVRTRARRSDRFAGRYGESSECYIPVIHERAATVASPVPIIDLVYCTEPGSAVIGKESV